MGRRRKSAGGEGFILILGLVCAAAVAVYRFVVDNAVVIGVLAVVAGAIYLLFKVFGAEKQETPPQRDQRELDRFVGEAPAAPIPRHKAIVAKWVRADERITFGKTQIYGGLFYFGDWIATREGANTQYVINSNLPVSATEADIEGNSMRYWPSFEDISPAARRAFLDWLSTGRNNPSYGIGHVFIFFYGLEHRLFIDNGDDSADVIREVERLLSIYGGNDSFDRYASQFLEHARIKLGEPLRTPPLSPDRPGDWEFDLTTRLYLGERLAASPILQAVDALRWVLASPETNLRTPATRCFEEFVSLWVLRFEKKYRNGLRIEGNDKILVRYRAASGAFEVEVRGVHDAYLDVASLSKPLKALQKLAENCTTELDAYSRVVGRRPTLRNSMVAFALLPEDLQRNTTSGAIGKFREEVSALLGKQGRATSTARTLLELAGIDVPSDGRISAASADQLGQALDLIDVAVEPDQRYGSGIPRAEKQVFIFAASKGGPVVPDRAPFKNQRMEIEVAVLAAGADGEATIEELQRTIARIRFASDLSGVEQARLIAFAVTSFNNPPKQARVMRKLAEASEDQRKAIASAAVTAVGTKATLDVQEVKFLERLHKSLGLPKEAVYDGLHRAAADRPDEPVAISEELRVAGIPIPSANPPAPPPTPIGIKIDSARLARTRRETDEVSALLSQIFEEEEVASAPTSSVGSGSIFEGLDSAHAQLIVLIEGQASMPRSEFDQYAKKLRLLPDGAIERINDWAFEIFDEALIEDGDEVALVSHLRGSIAELKEKVQ